VSGKTTERRFKAIQGDSTEKRKSLDVLLLRFRTYFLVSPMLSPGSSRLLYPFFCVILFVLAAPLPTKGLVRREIKRGRSVARARSPDGDRGWEKKKRKNCTADHQIIPWWVVALVRFRSDRLEMNFVWRNRVDAN